MCFSSIDAIYSVSGSWMRPPTAHPSSGLAKACPDEPRTVAENNDFAAIDIFSLESAAKESSGLERGLRNRVQLGSHVSWNRCIRQAGIDHLEPRYDGGYEVF